MRQTVRCRWVLPSEWNKRSGLFPPLGFAFALAGHETTMHLLRDALLAASLPNTVADVRTALTATFNGVFSVEYGRANTLMAGFQPQHLPIAEGIIGVYADGSPQLFHVNWVASVTHCTGKFVAGGSGKDFAEHAATVFRSLTVRDLSLYQSQMLGFRVIQDAIEIAGPNTAIGGAVQMATVRIDSAGTAILDLLAWDDQQLKDQVTSWTALDADRFLDHNPPEPPSSP